MSETISTRRLVACAATFITIGAVTLASIGESLDDKRAISRYTNEGFEDVQFKDQGTGLQVGYGACRLVFNQDDDGTYSYRTFKQPDPLTIRDVSYTDLAEVPYLQNCDAK